MLMYYFVITFSVLTYFRSSWRVGCDCGNIPMAIPPADLSWVKDDTERGLFGPIQVYRDNTGVLKRSRVLKSDRMWFYPPEPPGYISGTLPTPHLFFGSRVFVWQPVGVWKYLLKCPRGAECVGQGKAVYLYKSGYHTRVLYISCFLMWTILWFVFMQIHLQIKSNNALLFLTAYYTFFVFWYCRFVKFVMYPAGIVCWRRSCAVASAPKQPGVMAVARWGIGWHGILLSCANSVRLTKPCSLLSSQTREYTEDWCKPNMPWISCTSHCRTVAERAQCAANEKKKHMQIKKTSSSIWQHMCCKYSQRDKIQKRAANTTKPNTETRCKNRNALQILTTQPNTKTRCKYSQHNKIQKHTANTHNATKYRNALQILTTLQNNRNALQILTT